MSLSLTNTLSRKVLSLPFWLFFSFIRYSFPCLEWAAWFRLALQCSTACISSTTQDWSWSAWPQRNTSSPPQSSTWTWSHSSCACWNSVENAKDAMIRLKTGFLLDQIITPMKFILNDLEKHILLYRHNGFNVLCFFSCFITALNWPIVLFWYCIFSVEKKN